MEDYFLYIDDLLESQKVRYLSLEFRCSLMRQPLITCLPNLMQKDAEAVTRPILDALGEDYSICCQGICYSICEVAYVC